MLRRMVYNNTLLLLPYTSIYCRYQTIIIWSETKKSLWIWCWDLAWWGNDSLLRQKNVKCLYTIVLYLISSRQYVRVVKEEDLKSSGLRPRRFESCYCRFVSWHLFLAAELLSVLLGLLLLLNPIDPSSPCVERNQQSRYFRGKLLDKAPSRSDRCLLLFTDIASWLGGNLVGNYPNEFLRSASF